LVKPLKKSTLPVKKTYSYEEQNEEERQQFIKMMKEEKNEDLVYIAKHTKVDMIWVAGRSPTLVSQNLKATTLTYLAILTSLGWIIEMFMNMVGG
jgi:uncharacterized Fe-S cluster-containing radical SAM superfamily protein